MAVAGSESLEISSSDDVVRVRQIVRDAAVALGFSIVDQTKLVTAASELARNTLVYGGGGVVEVDRVENGRRSGIRTALNVELGMDMLARERAADGAWDLDSDGDADESETPVVKTS